MSTINFYYDIIGFNANVCGEVTLSSTRFLLDVIETTNERFYFCPCRSSWMTVNCVFRQYSSTRLRQRDRHSSSMTSFAFCANIKTRRNGAKRRTRTLISTVTCDPVGNRMIEHAFASSQSEPRLTALACKSRPWRKITLPPLLSAHIYLRKTGIKENVASSTTIPLDR